jgi:hypothetical protein
VYSVTVYEFHDPRNLPLPKLTEFVLPENDAQFAKWSQRRRFVCSKSRNEARPNPALHTDRCQMHRFQNRSLSARPVSL